MTKKRKQAGMTDSVLLHRSYYAKARDHEFSLVATVVVSLSNGSANQWDCPGRC